jgi:hypothetical protein
LIVTKKNKANYRVRNWGEYSKSLVRRGSLTVWVSEEVIKRWKEVEPTGKRGRPARYSDLVIECMAMLKEVFHLPLRATQGLLESLLKLMNIEVEAPDYSTLCRRRRGLKIAMPRQGQHNGMHLVVDSTGVKVFGEGEWKVRQHGKSKRRTWKKLHVGVDEATGEIVAVVVTDNSVADHQVVPELLAQVTDEITQVSGDGAYDKRPTYTAIKDRQARATIPPRRGARIWKHGNTKGERHIRDDNVRSIRKYGRKAWKQMSGYHRRSLAETTMARFKRITGSTINARSFLGQVAEITIRCKALNIMNHLGRPDTYLTLV